LPTVELFRAALESAPAGILLVDARGCIVLVNRQVESLFGYDRDELLGRSVEMLLPERFRAQHPEFRERFLQDPQMRRMGAGRDLYGLRKDGTEVPLEVGLTPVRTDEGWFVISSFVDVSERKLADERFRLAVDSSPNGMVMIDRGGRMVLVNREIERMFGYGRGQLLGKPIEMLVPARFRDRHPLHRENFFVQPERRSMGIGRDLFALRADGTEFPVEIGLNPISTAAGLFVLGSVVDISPRRRAEEQRRNLEDQLRQAQKMEAIGQLASGIAHDFKNLLAGILGCNNLALRAAKSETPLHDYLTEIKDAAERGAALTRQLLEFGREQVNAPAPLPLNGIVGAAERMLRRVIGEDVRMTLELAAVEDTILADRTHIEQILMNLVINARDAMPDGGRLAIATRGLDLAEAIQFSGLTLRPGSYVTLEIVDSGSGMDQRTRDRLFEPFFSTKTIGKGTGLGLYTVYGIVRQLGGAIEVESEVGIGTTFTVYLPTSKTSPVPSVGVMETESQRAGGETILLVEDERLIRTTLRIILREAGYSVIVAGDPAEALQLAAARPAPIHLLLTDMIMPGSTGAELASALKATRPDMQVLLMSAFPAEWLVRQGRVLPGTRVLEKPFEDALLLGSIREALDAARAASGHVAELS
jgi:PAS domain S-box-containing protein